MSRVQMSPTGEFVVPLQEGWQGGPASITLHGDELNLDGGTVGPGVIIMVNTPTDADGQVEVPLGTGTLRFPPGNGQLEFWVSASLEQARDLYDALGLLLGLEAGEQAGS